MESRFSLDLPIKFTISKKIAKLLMDFINISIHIYKCIDACCGVIFFLIVFLGLLLFIFLYPKIFSNVFMISMKPIFIFRLVFLVHSHPVAIILF